MTPDAQARVEEALRLTAEDHRLSRGERVALASLFEEVGSAPEVRAFIRNRAFDVMREHDLATDGPALLVWLEGVMKLLSADDASSSVAGSRSDALFSPGEACRGRIRALLDDARECVDICVFTITDDSVAERIAAAHRRGVSVRVITDDEKSRDLGSDAERLEAFGVPVRMDVSEHHMHHKYALFDRRLLLTGSYNWTRSAAKYNRENIIVTDEAALVERFQTDFDAFWEELGRWSTS